MRINIAALLLGLLAPFLAPNNSHAVPLLGNLPGATTFGDFAMLHNDDESSHRINFPLDVDFYGNRYDSFFVNHNGNVSFNGLISEYTPTAFPITDQQMIAPYWCDVDTRGGDIDIAELGNNAYVSSSNTNTVVVTWNNVASRRPCVQYIFRHMCCRHGQESVVLSIADLVSSSWSGLLR